MAAVDFSQPLQLHPLLKIRIKVNRLIIQTQLILYGSAISHRTDGHFTEMAAGTETWHRLLQRQWLYIIVVIMVMR